MMEGHAKGLEAVKELCLNSAPELIAFSVLKNGVDCVLMTQIRGIGKTMPVPCQGAAWRMIKAEGKQKLLDDVQKLCDRGVVNEAFYHTQEWHVVESAGSIVISNWSLLHGAVSQDDGKRMLESVKSEFDERGI